jgi:hypothetical protein
LRRAVGEAEESTSEEEVARKREARRCEMREVGRV